MCGRLSSYYDYAPLLRECFRGRLRTVPIDTPYAWTNVMHQEELASPVCHPIISTTPAPLAKNTVVIIVLEGFARTPDHNTGKSLRRDAKENKNEKKMK